MSAVITGRGSCTGAPGEAPDRERLLALAAEAGERRDVDDAPVARDQRLDRAERLGGMAELRERREQRPAQVGEALVAAPEQAEQLGAAVAVELRGERRRLVPEARERVEIGQARELLLEILLDVPDVLVAEAQARARSAAARARASTASMRSAVGRGLGLEVAVEEEGVADDLDDVGGRQQAQADRDGPAGAPAGGSRSG